MGVRFAPDDKLHSRSSQQITFVRSIDKHLPLDELPAFKMNSRNAFPIHLRSLLQLQTTFHNADSCPGNPLIKNHLGNLGLKNRSQSSGIIEGRRPLPFLWKKVFALLNPGFRLLIVQIGLMIKLPGKTAQNL